METLYANLLSSHLKIHVMFVAPSLEFVENYKKPLGNKKLIDKTNMLRMLQQSKNHLSYFTSFAAAQFITR